MSSTIGPRENPLRRSGEPSLLPWIIPTLTDRFSKMTDVYEGSLIRVFRRLEEALRQMAQAAKVMGNEELEKKFEESLTKVKRDIVAAQSLYL
jgi:superfamily II RNA helicase